MKISPDPKYGERLNLSSRHTLQDTAHPRNTQLTKSQMHTVHSTQNRLLFHCVFSGRWKYTISFMGQFRSQDGSQYCDHLIDHLFPSSFWQYHHSKHLQLPGATLLLFNQPFYEFDKIPLTVSIVFQHSFQN